MRAFITLVLLALSVFSSAQNLSGRWIGVYPASNEKDQPSKIEVELKVEQDTLVTGTSHLYYPNGDHELYAISGQYFREDSSIYFTEDSIISVGQNVGAYCRGSYVMMLTVDDTYMRFDGRRKPLAGAFGMEDCAAPLDVFLERGAKKKLPPPEPPKPKEKIPERNELVQKVIEISKEEMDSIRIELVDNAQIDNDVVSVYLNDESILRKHKLTAVPAVFWISLSKTSDVATIRMAAESMGSIPPCTALMTVITRKNRYPVTLSSDMGNTGILKLSLKQ